MNRSINITELKYYGEPVASIANLEGHELNITIHDEVNGYIPIACTFGYNSLSTFLDNVKDSSKITVVYKTGKYSDYAYSFEKETRMVDGVVDFIPIN